MRVSEVFFNKTLNEQESPYGEIYYAFTGCLVVLTNINVFKFNEIINIEEKYFLQSLIMKSYLKTMNSKLFILILLWRCINDS